MIKITLLLCLIAVCLSERDEYSYGKINTIELRSNEDNELMDNSNEDHDLEYEKRYILSVTGDLKTVDQEVAQLIRELVELIQNLLKLLKDDGKGIIVNLQSILTGVLAAVLNLVASLLALLGILLGGIVNSLISLNTDLTGNIQQVTGVIGTINSDLTHVIVGVAGQVTTDITNGLTTIITTIPVKVGRLTTLIPLITDLNLKNTVQNLITELNNLIPGLGQLVDRLLSLVLKLVGQILDTLTRALAIVNPIFSDLTAGTVIDIQRIVNLNVILANLKDLLGQVIDQLDDLPTGIVLKTLLQVVIDFVLDTLVRLISQLSALPAFVNTPALNELTLHQADLAGLVARIP